ncbi:MAG TPA: carboxypeptidase-like regulatory domain-containing protein, partial [Candidatus Solibacter sp.]|nr:carboxypeptidase-like regulatory domain-containing protein [Candidatus Solibacter sp.]
MLAVLTLPLAAQVDHASLSGTITDSSGAVVQGAKVEAVSPETGFRRDTLTGGSGTFQMPALAVGTYSVTVSKAGFRTVDFKAVELAIGQTRTIDAKLQVGSISEAVEVTAALETVNRTSAEVGGLIDAEQIREIPVSG